MDDAPKKQQLVKVPSTMLKLSLALLTAALFCSDVSAQDSISSSASPSSCIQVKGANFKDGTAIVM